MVKYFEMGRRNWINIIAFIVFFLIFVVHFFLDFERNLLIGLLGTTATLYFGLLKFHFEKDKLFQEFNSRYNKKLNDLINELKYDEERIVTPKEKNRIIDYFNLSSEE